MSHTVTAGLDGSRESRAALDWAAAEAVRRSATLEIVQVHETGVYPFSQLQDDQVEIDHAERVVQEAADAVGSRHPGLRLTSQVVAGRPANVLDEIASRSDLLVLGTRGLGGLRGFFVGSAALPAVAHARCPVVLVRAPKGEDAVDRKGDVVVGLKPDKAPQEILDFAFDAAARRSARLRVRYGLEAPPTHRFRHRREAPAADARMIEEQTERLRSHLRPWQERHPTVQADCRTLVGPPAAELVEEAADAALLVVGRRPHTHRVGTYIGPVTHAVMHHAVVPVAVIPHD
ncbi:universal stress protein [Streptomyces sp. DSM 42041]|uniref:Universal stress protein n=1 Tax=Streptomyces hazeniae TaxID=3075538 RepID=A0ABU2NJM0_9ACTN|nr:universal stress protein [Streptomyces sp. DSM 42041]MDT0377190.1 universal stress protein [Streptomyces sp. DSM 42041]